MYSQPFLYHQALMSRSLFLLCPLCSRATHLSLRSRRFLTPLTITLPTGNSPPINSEIMLTRIRTYFAGAQFGFGDALIWGTIRGNVAAVGSMKKPGRPHLARWYNHVETLPVPRAALESFTKAKSDMERGKKAKRTESVDVVLPNAVPGKVVVRFGRSPGKSVETSLTW